MNKRIGEPVQAATFRALGVSYLCGWGFTRQGKGVGPMKRMNKVLVRHGMGILGVAALVLGALVLAPRLMAEDSDASQASRAVRLSNVEGEVHLSQGNQPLADQAV